MTNVSSARISWLLIGQADTMAIITHGICSRPENYDSGAPVVAHQAQGQATQGRDLSTLASLRALRARTPKPGNQNRPLRSQTGQRRLRKIGHIDRFGNLVG